MKIVSRAPGWERIYTSFLILFIFSQPLFCVSDAWAGKKLRGKVAFRSVQESDEHLWEKRLNHPIRFTQGEFRQVVGSLYFARKLQVLWGEPEPIFDKKIVSSLSEVLRKKLLEIKHNETLHFLLNTSAGRTKGDLFIIDQAVNWRFSEIKGMDYIMDTQSVAQESGGEILINWKLAPQKNQDYFHSENVLGFKTREEVWITVPVKDRAGMNSGDPQSVPDTNEVKKKLKMLKELKEEKLISDQDYEIKVKKLLREF